jgi:diguanylate cyclase (GGDEF)-like protein
VKEEPAPPYILIVDDEEGIRRTLRDIIYRAGYRSQGVASGDEALTFLQNQEVDIVITDVRMPGMDGFELTERIKKQYTCDVIVITGHGSTFSYEEALEKGASDFAQKPIRPKELIARLKRVLRERAMVEERKEMEAQLRRLTITDALTKLFNSRHFFKEIQSEIYRARRYDHPLSLLLLDIDRFKTYNDNYGHLEGDKVLAALGSVIQGCLRTNDSAYRYGGDEFTIILPVTRGKEALTVAERIREEFSAMDFSFGSHDDFEASVSIGITELRPDEDWKDLTRRADEAMYKAKKKGGNQTALL